jgi:hypothetical protein
VVSRIGIRVDRERTRDELVRPTDIGLAVRALNSEDPIEELE